MIFVMETNEFFSNLFSQMSNKCAISVAYTEITVRTIY